MPDCWDPGLTIIKSFTLSHHLDFYLSLFRSFFFSQPNFFINQGKFSLINNCYFKSPQHVGLTRFICLPYVTHTFRYLRGSLLPNSMVEPILMATQRNSLTAHNIISLKYVSWSIITVSVTAIDCEQQTAYTSTLLTNQKYSRPVNHFECSWIFERHWAGFVFGGKSFGEGASLIITTLMEY